MAQARPASLILLAALVLVACDVTNAPSATTAPATAAVSGASAQPGARSAEPSPLATARPGIKTAPVGTIPSLFRYVALETPLVDGAHTRLWLVDLSSKRAPVLAAEWDAPVSPVGGSSVSADGRTVLISASGTRSRVALSVLRPETGETRVLFEDPTVTAVAARVSPDGARFAFTRYPAQGGFDQGIWVGRIAGGELARITAPTTDTTTPQMPVAWSPDSARLAFTRDLADGTEIRVVRADGGDEKLAGPGERAAWRTAAPELAIEQAVGAGARVYTIDVTTGKSTDIVKEDKGSVAALAWHPSGDRLAYVLSEGASREASGGIWIWRADSRTASRTDAGKTVFAPEWSGDGSVLSALAGGDDARIPIVDLLTGRQLSVLCRRGGTPPADCV